MKNKEVVRKLELTSSQYWLVTKAIVMLTSAEGETQLRTEYPEIDPKALAEDVGVLVDKLVALQ